MANDSLKGLIQRMNVSGTGLYTATVVSDSPVSVRLNNESRILLGGRVLCVPGELGRRKLTLLFEGEAQERSAVADFSLKAGEQVYILQLPDKKYFVLGRV